MKKIAIMVDQLYQELEVWYPYYRFLEAGHKVDLVAPLSNHTYPSKLGYPCDSTVSAADVNGTDYDAVVVPGGWCPDFMRRDLNMIRFIQQCAKADIILAAICHGGWMLASAGILKGRTVTSFFAIRDDLENAGAKWVDEEVVRDGSLITSRKPADLPAFCRTIIGATRES